MESKFSNSRTRAPSTTPSRSRPVSAMARVRSANRIRGSMGRGAQTSVYSARAASRAGRDRMMSPMAPGRMRSLAADTYRQREVDGFGRQAHAIVACLVAQLAGEVYESGGHGSGDLEARGQ